MEDLISNANPTPDPEVRPRPRRRTFSTDYKLSILQQADACTQRGELGALLRREGLYSSHLSKWRQQLQDGRLNSPRRTAANQRAPTNDLRKENRRLQRENQRLLRKLQQAEMVIDVQKKLSALLGINSENDPYRTSS